jgi:hypothetical protein
VEEGNMNEIYSSSSSSWGSSSTIFLLFVALVADFGFLEAGFSFSAFGGAR